MLQGGDIGIGGIQIVCDALQLIFCSRPSIHSLRGSNRPSLVGQACDDLIRTRLTDRNTADRSYAGIAVDSRVHAKGKQPLRTVYNNMVVTVCFST